MKYKALILSLLLLMPFGAFVSFVSADWPNPVIPTHTPILFVDVNSTGVHGSTGKWNSTLKVWGPCIVSSFFTVDVKLWNDKDITGEDVFAFDFNITWNANTTAYPNDPHIKLTNIATHLPTGWQVVYQDTFAWALNHFGFHYAATDVNADPGLIKAINVSLVTLTFHIEDDPLYNDYFTTGFTLTNNGMSGDGTVPTQLTPELDHGYYYIGSRQPDIHLSSPDQFGPLPATDPNYPGLYFINESAIKVVHTIKVYLSNITHAYAFYVKVCFSSDYKKTDLQHVRIGPDWILTNYAYENIVVSADCVEVTVIRPKPPVKSLICSKYSEAFEFDLTVKSPDVGGLPDPENTTISISSAWLLEWEDYAPYIGPVQYNFIFIGPTPLETPTPEVSQYPIYYSCPLVNMWKPKLMDLSLDGHVNIDDLLLVIDEYGNTHVYATLSPIGAGTKVDIFDCVAIAKSFGDC